MKVARPQLRPGNPQEWFGVSFPHTLEETAGLSLLQKLEGRLAEARVALGIPQLSSFLEEL